MKTSHDLIEAKVIQVIEVSAPVGKGTPDDPIRIVRRYFNLDGTLLAEEDPTPQEQK